MMLPDVLNPSKRAATLKHWTARRMTNEFGSVLIKCWTDGSVKKTIKADALLKAIAYVLANDVEFVKIGLIERWMPQRCACISMDAKKHVRLIY